MGMYICAECERAFRLTTDKLITGTCPCEICGYMMDHWTPEHCAFTWDITRPMDKNNVLVQIRQHLTRPSARDGASEFPLINELKKALQ